MRIFSARIQEDACRKCMSNAEARDIAKAARETQKKNDPFF